MAELTELARSAGLEVAATVIQHRSRMDPRFLMGKGRLTDMVIQALQVGSDLLVFDAELTPAQVRSITDFTELRVIDRTQLILDLFAQRARTREGKLQVEMAQVKYLLPRLRGREPALELPVAGPQPPLHRCGQTQAPSSAIFTPMDLRDDECYLALAARDTRFDGRFFTCVRSTGIYCRPVCPARTQGSSRPAKVPYQSR